MINLNDGQVSLLCDSYCRFPFQVRNDEKLDDICLTCPMNGAEADAPDRPELPKWGEVVE